MGKVDVTVTFDEKNVKKRFVATLLLKSNGLDSKSNFYNRGKEKMRLNGRGLKSGI
jgi:hypothetical protein